MEPTNLSQPLPLCDGSYHNCVMERGDVCEGGRTADECEIDEEKNSGQEYETYYVEEGEYKRLL